MSEPRVEIAKLLLAQDDEVLTAEALLRRMMDLTGADRGFVVAKEDDHFNPTFAVQFDMSGNDQAARFSRSMVRAALAQNRVVHSLNPAEDAELKQLESMASAFGRAVLVVPLSSGEQCFGAIYLEHPKAAGFSGEAVQLVSDAAELAGLCLHVAVKRSALAKRTSALERELFAQHDFGGIVTRDPGMLALLRTVAQIASAKATVLVLGESGTGKELIAKALHVNSDRRRGPFVALHCAALPSSMLESELFGHVKGAFTGADRDRLGRLASAHGGTLFLDEVAEIPMETQAKLLRAIQFGELQRLGTDRIEKVDVRVVAATHRNLAEDVAQGRFRQDLYYRLRVVELTIPPLRERPGDVALLSHHFVQQSKPGARLSAATIRKLEAHAWPGNVRELMHALERVCLLSSGNEIDPELLPDDVRAADRSSSRRASSQSGTISRISSVPSSESQSASAGEPPYSFARFDKRELEAVIETLTRQVEKDFIDGLLASHGGNVSKAASESGIHRSHLQRMMARVRG